MSAPIGTPPPRPLATVMASGRIPDCWNANHCPVRPMPVWISSMTSRAPAAVAISRAACRYAGSAATTPPSPWIGSRTTAAVSGVTAARRASASAYGMWVTPGRSGSNGSRYAGLWVSPGAPGELDRCLDRLGAAVGEEDLGARRCPGDVEQPLGEGDLGRRGEEVGDVHDLGDLLGHSRDESRVAVPQRIDGDAAEQVEVAPTVDVPDVAALAVVDDDGRAVEDAEDRILVAVEVCRGGRGRRHGESFSMRVPMPSEVNTSRSSECGCRPSMTWACGTPSSTARMHASSLGIMPSSTRVNSSRASATDNRDSSESRSGQLA